MQGRLTGLIRSCGRYVLILAAIATPLIASGQPRECEAAFQEAIAKELDIRPGATREQLRVGNEEAAYRRKEARELMQASEAEVRKRFESDTNFLTDPDNSEPYLTKYRICVAQVRLQQLGAASLSAAAATPAASPAPLPDFSSDQKAARFEEVVEGKKVDWTCQAYSCKSDMNQRFLREIQRYQQIDCDKAYGQKDCARHKVKEAQIRACMALCDSRLECRRRTLDDGKCIDPYFK